MLLIVPTSNPYYDSNMNKVGREHGESRKGKLEEQEKLGESMPQE